MKKTILLLLVFITSYLMALAEEPWPESKRPERVYDPFGSWSIRPYKCCVTCGDDYRYNNGRCLKDENGLIKPVDDKGQVDVYMDNPKSCCQFCGHKILDFVYGGSDVGCIRSKEDVVPVVDYSEMKCHLCKFLVSAIQTANDFETDSPLDGEWLKSCAVFYMDKNVCVSFLNTYYDKIKTEHLGAPPQKACFGYGFCSSSGPINASPFKKVINDLRSGKAQLEFK